MDESKSAAGRPRAKHDHLGLRKRSECLVWAVAEQLRILDGGDALLIKAIQHGRPPSPLIERFLKDYGLWRWNAFKRGERVETFIDIAEKRFRPRPPDLSKADRPWHLAVEDFTGDGGPKPYSAFLKLYWFYQPHLLTMYDTYARKGLRAAEDLLGIRAVPRRVTDQNFLARFEAVYQRLAPEIRKAIRMFGRRYPFERRVLDKYLWLLGVKEPESRLENFKASLKLAPLRGTK